MNKKMAKVYRKQTVYIDVYDKDGRWLYRIIR